MTIDCLQILKMSWLDGEKGFFFSFTNNTWLQEEHLRLHNHNRNIRTHCMSGSKILSSLSGPAPASTYTHA